MSLSTKNIEKHWATIQPILTIRNEREYERALGMLNSLLDDIGANEKHPLYGLLDTLGALVHAYEETHHPIPESSGAEMLSFLMEEHGLTKSDLPEIGSQTVVSQVLNGKRELRARQISALAKRFGVSPAVFL